MTNDEALTEYGCALGFILTYWEGPERDENGKGTLGRRCKSVDFSAVMNTKT